MAWGDHSKTKKIRGLIEGALKEANKGYKYADNLLAENKGKDSPIPGSKEQHGIGVPNSIALGSREIIISTDKDLAKLLRTIADMIEHNKL